MIKQPARFYTAFSGIFLLLQGTSTLAFRLVPPLDQAFPQLLAVTQMIPLHSSLHIITGVLALFVLWRGGERGAFWFALGFGAFYSGLAFYGFITHEHTIFGLQPFDHPFHLFLGMWGLVVASWVYFKKERKAA
jgi:hypothetical protein